MRGAVHSIDAHAYDVKRPQCGRRCTDTGVGEREPESGAQNSRTLTCADMAVRERSWSYLNTPIYTLCTMTHIIFVSVRTYDLSGLVI